MKAPKTPAPLERLGATNATLNGTPYCVALELSIQKSSGNHRGGGRRRRGEHGRGEAFKDVLRNDSDDMDTTWSPDESKHIESRMNRSILFAEIPILRHRGNNVLENRSIDFLDVHVARYNENTS